MSSSIRFLILGIALSLVSACGKKGVPGDAPEAALKTFSQERLGQALAPCTQTEKQVGAGQAGADLDFQCINFYTDTESGDDRQSGESGEIPTKTVDQAFANAVSAVPATTRLQQDILLVFHVRRHGHDIEIPLSQSEPYLVFLLE